MTENTHGGRRDGSGRKPTINGKKVMVVLDDDTLGILDAWQTALGWNRSEAIRNIVLSARAHRRANGLPDF